MSWWNEYVGVPFLERGRNLDGVDCWGLVQLILQEQFAIKVPDLLDEYYTTGDAEHNQQIVLNQEAEWRADWQQVSEAKEGDIVVLRVNGLPVHVGLVIQPGMFIHCWRKANTTIESYRSAHWTNRVDSFWRYIA